MKTLKNPFIYFTIIFITIFFTNCRETKNSEKVEEKTTSETKKTENVVEVVTNIMDFQTLDTIPSGWNTFKYINKSSEVHFLLIDKYPNGKTLEDTHRDVMPPFDKGMELIIEGNMEEAMAEFGKLPEWFGEIVFTGGSGLLSPKHTSLTTVKLEPGLHIIECYVKMNNGKFHTSMGMTKEIWVTEKVLVINLQKQI